MRQIYNKNILTVNNNNKNLFDNAIQRVKGKNFGASVIVPHVCNNVGLFGAGFAGAVRDKFPIVSTNFELLGKKTKLGYVQYVSVFKDDTHDHELIFSNMIAQNGIIGKNNPRPLNYEYLVKCMIDIRNFISNLKKDKIEIHCPKFGSGLAGGDWNFISSLIDDIWGKFNVVVYSYNNNNNRRV
jgi:hypothetical protein